MIGWIEFEQAARRAKLTPSVVVMGTHWKLQGVRTVDVYPKAHRFHCGGVVAYYRNPTLLVTMSVKYASEVLEVDEFRRYLKTERA
jgi:hypothetical protein